MTEPTTLYKLMIMYLLHKVNFPLTNSQLSEFLVSKEYTSYFTFQTVINELLDAKLILHETVRNTTRYELTREGEEALMYFGKNISEAIVKDMDEYIRLNKFKLRSEVGIVSDYYKSTNQDYIVHCEIREGKGLVFEMNISMPTAEQAEAMCQRWQEENQSIYGFVMQKMME